MPERTIGTTARTRSLQLAECLQSLFVLELLSPSKACYLISPWITDFAVLNNAHGQFRALLPEYIQHEVRLSVILRALHDRGTTVHVVTRSDSQDFLARLPQNSDQLLVKIAPQLHVKSFVCQSFVVTGSMNFTYTGVNQSDEQVRISTDREAVDEAFVDAHVRWENA